MLKRMPWIISAVLLTALIIWLIPSPIQPQAWQPSPAPSNDNGPFAHNNKLADIQRLGSKNQQGPEDIIIANNHLYTGYASGDVLRYDLGGQNGTTLVNTGGRPLGLAALDNGDLLIADAKKGLLRLTPQGQLSVLADHYQGKKLRFVDELAVSQDQQTLYFTDASTRFEIQDYKLDMMEHHASGRVFRYQLNSGKLDLILDGLHFANGIALGPDDQYFLVNETNEYRISRYWLKGPKAGQKEDFISGLPGYPDNISFNGKNRFWVGIPTPRNALLEYMANKPWLAKLAAKAPRWLQPHPANHGIVIALDLNGNVVANLQDPSKNAYGYITTALEHGQALFFGSLYETQIGYLPMPQLQ